MADNRGAFLGTGKIYLEDLDDSKGLMFIGNCSSLEYVAEPEDIPEPDYTTPGGGLDTSVQRISALQVSYEARHFNMSNISRALYGTSTDVIAGTITDEEHTAYPGALVLLKNPGASGIVITAGGTPLVLDTDYIVNYAGMPEIIESSLVVTAGGTAIKVSYKHKKYATVQALVTSGKRFRMVFLGLNEASTGRLVSIEVFRVNHSPASLSFIGDAFQGMQFTASVEKDKSVIGTGLSQYMVIKDVA